MNEKASSKTIPTKTYYQIRDEWIEKQNDKQRWVSVDVLRQKLQQVFKKAEVICYAANGDEIIMYDPKILKEVLIELEQKRRGENHKDE